MSLPLWDWAQPSGIGAECRAEVGVHVAGAGSREGPACGLWRWVWKGRAGEREQDWCRQDGGRCGDQEGVRQLQHVETRG